MEETVTYGSEHIEALRIWKVDMKKLMLKSVTGEIWVPGEIKRSSCSHVRVLHPDNHLKPAINCHCGIWSCKSRKALWDTDYGIMPLTVRNSPAYDDYYSFRRIRTRIEDEYFVAGRIELWGVVIEHETGYRSEYARIIPHTLHWWPREKRGKHAKLLKFLREKYDPIPV